METKEIDINIEGYNVNGICVGCLNYNRRMFYHRDVKKCFLLLGNIDVPDGLAVQVCWECLAVVRKVIQFQERINASYEVLSAYSKQHTFLDCPNDISQHSSTSLQPSGIVVYQDVTPSGNDEVENDEVKMEDIEVKLEEVDAVPQLDPSEETNYDSELPDFYVPLNFDAYSTQSSDEDVALSHLKQQNVIETRKKHKNKTESKQKKIRKDEKKKSKQKKIKKEEKKESKQKKMRKEEKKLKKQKYKSKLKNLPDLVEVTEFSDSEVIDVRMKDVMRDAFVKCKFRCDKCVRSFNTKKLMEDHISSKHVAKSPEAYKCNICECYLLSKENANSHRELHKSGYKCTKCGFKTTAKKIIEAHIAEHGSGLKCHLCGSTFSSKSRLQYHKSVCAAERPQCDCCGKVFANKLTLKYHLKLLQPSNKSGEKCTEKVSIVCPGCEKVFNSRKSYRAHAVIHSGVSHPCPECGKLFHWKRNLARHMRNHRDRETGAIHECVECGVRFSSRDCLANHMRLSKKHLPVLNHVCGYCGKSFATKYCLVDHVDWEHLKRIKYTCVHCHKPFKTAKILVAHVKNIHRKTNPEVEGEHLCDICGKSYKTEKRLKSHVWAMHTHRSTCKSFKCPLCPASFTWQTSIYKHVKIMHHMQLPKDRRLQVPPKQELESYQQFPPTLPTTADLL